MKPPTPSGLPAWHAPDDQLEDYAAKTLDVARSASVEQHLLGCADCRSRLAAIARTDANAGAELDALWLDVIDTVDLPRPGVVRVVLRRLGCSDTVSMVVAATPALRFSWLTSIVVALVFAFLMATGVGVEGAFLLVIAPLIPLLGIGTAYGTGVDPLHELARAAPLPGSRVFLYRSLAVLLTALPVVLAGSLLLPVDGTAAVGWLLPALGLAGLTLALSTWTEPRTAALVAGGGWLAALSGTWVRASGVDGARLTSLLLFRPAGQVLFAVLALAGAAVFWMRLERIDAPHELTMEVR
jgi:hypothetical protein